MDPVILDGVRTPFGKWKGSLSQFSAKDLGAAAVKELLNRVPEAKDADGVLLAQVIQAGQGQNPARQVAVKAGISLTTPAVTLNNVCLAGLASVSDAVRRIQYGEGELFVTGGFDSMTNAPHTAVIRQGSSVGPVQFQDTLHDGLWCSLSDQSMGVLTEDKNKELDIHREEQDEYALLSQKRAVKAQQNGFLADEIIPIETKTGTLKDDEGIRSQSTFKVYECEDCSGCPLRSQCTKAKEGHNRKILYNEKWEQQKETIRELLSEEKTGEIYGKRKIGRGTSLWLSEG